MLLEIHSDKFLEKPIKFHQGLNVVLGDNEATNSIGKSSLLMVIDFVFGGDSFLEKNSDTVAELGNHSYDFSFSFSGQLYYFSRETYDSKVIYKCDNQYNRVSEISIDDFRSFLNNQYALDDLFMTFRSIVSPYSRVWGKDNEDPKKPINSFKKQRDTDAIYNLFKLFNKYQAIALSYKEYDESSKSKKALDVALKFQHIPQITKSEFKHNEHKIKNIQSEIINIRNDLARYAVSIKEILTQEVLDLKDEKDEHLNYKIEIESKLRRIKTALNENSFFKSHHLSKLQEFFPSVNLKQIEKVEAFHEGIKQILKDEMKKSEEILSSNLSAINAYIGEVDSQILSALTNKVDNPSQIICIS